MFWTVLASALLFWTVLIFLLGGAVGAQMEKDKNEPKYQDGDPIPPTVTFNYNDSQLRDQLMNARAETDGLKLDVLWEFYTSEDWKTNSTLVAKTEILWDMLAGVKSEKRLQDALNDLQEYKTDG